MSAQKCLKFRDNLNKIIIYIYIRFYIWKNLIINLKK